MVGHVTAAASMRPRQSHAAVLSPPGPGRQPPPLSRCGLRHRDVPHDPSQAADVARLRDSDGTTPLPRLPRRAWRSVGPAIIAR